MGGRWRGSAVCPWKAWQAGLTLTHGAAPLTRLTLTYGAALPGHLDGVHAALATRRGHAMGLSIDALAESAVVLPPAGTVGSDLATGVAAGWVAERVHGICGDSRGLGVRRGAAPRQLSWPGVGRPPAGTWAEGGKKCILCGSCCGAHSGTGETIIGRGG